MNKPDFPELLRIQEHRSKTHIFYWISAILFWSGVSMAIKYLFVTTGTTPSYIPGLFMLSGAGIYFLVHYYVK